MRLQAIFCLAFALAAAALPSRTERALGADDSTHLQTRCKTNAECLRRGMPLLPQSRRKRQVVTPGPSGRAVRQFRIAVVDATTGVSYGFLARVLYSFYGVTTDVTAAVIATIPSTAQGTNDLNLMTDSDANYPYMCLVFASQSTGSDNLEPGSDAYTWLGGCAEPPTNPDSAPVSGINTQSPGSGQETAIWQFSSTSTTISPQWTNSGLSQSPNFILFIQTQNFFSITGDIAAYRARFGTTGRPEVTFQYIPVV